MPYLNKIIYSIFSLFLGIFLVWLAIQQTPVDFNLVKQHLNNLNYAYLVAILITSFLNIWLTAYKWKLTTELIVGIKSKNQKFYLTYITLGSLLGQFMPQQISMMSVQSFAMKAHQVSNVVQGLFTVIYDQVFNVLIPLLLVIPALLLIFNKITVSVAIFLSCFILFIAYFLMQNGYIYFMKIFVSGYYRLKYRHKKKKENVQNSKQIVRQLIINKKDLSRFFILATIRYFNLVLRWILVLFAAHIKIKIAVIAFATPIIYLAMILSITPANLGIVEWSWLGILKMFGIAEIDAITFALVQRVLFFLSIILISLVFLLFSLKKHYLNYNTHHN